MNVLIMKGLTLPSVSDAELAAIAEAAGPGSNVTLVDGAKEAAAVAADVEVVLGVMPAKLFATMAALRWVHATASGVDMFMYPEFVNSDVVLTGEKGLVGGHLADHGFGLLLALTRQIHTAIKLGPNAWARREAMRGVEIELEGLTMGIVGFGGTGRAMARRAAAFGMNVVALDELEVAAGDGVDEVWPRARLEELVGRSDVVAVCCPLTKATENLFDDRLFAVMRPGAILVNVTRGEVVDGDALVRALASGHLGGAALDVMSGEPLAADHPIWAFDNVVMTPHTAGASQLRAGRNVSRFVDNLVRYGAGQPLAGVVDKQAGF